MKRLPYILFCMLIIVADVSAQISSDLLRKANAGDAIKQ